MTGPTAPPTAWQRFTAWLTRKPQAKPRDASPKGGAPEEVPGAGPLHPDTMDLEGVCPTCGGRRVVTVEDAQGHATRMPCPECAPNDALGG